MPKHLLTGILLGSVDQEVADTPRVTPLVIVPGDQLDEVLVQLDAGSGIEDGGSRVADKIGGDDSLVGVFENALVLGLGSSLNDSLNLLVGGVLLEADDEIDDGDVDCGNAEGKTAVNR